MGSSRLPGKVLMDVCGKPLLKLQLERINRSRLIDRVIVATSKNTKDDKIETFCIENGVDCYRGPENDVLQRIASVICEYQIDIHVECFGDSPLVDPQLIDEFVGYYLKFKNRADFFSNTLKTTYPPGLEVSVYEGRTLLEVNQLVSSDDPMREHVGFNITRFPKKFRLKSLEAPPWFRFPNIYLEVDTIEDLVILRNIVSAFFKKGKYHFGLAEVLSLIETNPNLIKGNSNIERKWKALREQKHI